MSLEAIKTITTAEAEAEKQRLEAQGEAKRIVAAAEAAGKEAVQAAKAAADREVRELCRAAQAEGEKAAAHTAGEVEAQRRALEETAGDRMAQAVDIIVERVGSG